MKHAWARPRVVVLSHTAVLSGGELALVRLIRAIAEDVDVHVILGEDGPLAGELASAGASSELLLLSGRSRNLRRSDVTTRQVPWRAAADIAAYTERLARRLRQLAPDVVHTNTLKAAFYGGVAARLAGCPCLWHVRDRIATDYLPAQAVHLTRVLARVLPTAVVTDTGQVLSTLHLRPGSGHVIPSPIPAHTTARPARPEGSFRVAMIGRLAPWKGQEVFVKAFVEAFPSGDETAVLIGSAMFGEEPYEAHLHQLIDRLGASRRVQLLGFRRDIEEELTRTDALVHASVLPEPFGQVVLEGMAAGVPVVASAAGGPAEVIADGRDGLLTPPGDVHALAVALRSLRSDAGLRERLVSGGRLTAAQFSPDAIGPRFVELYQAMGATSRR